MIEQILDEFWFNVFKKLDRRQYILVILRVIYDTGEIISLDKMYRINYFDKEYLLRNYLFALDLKSEYYTDKHVKELVLQFWLSNRDSSNLGTNVRLDLAPKNTMTKQWKKLKKKNIPSNQDYSSWGHVLYEDNNFIRIQDKKNINKTYNINIGKGANPVVKVDILNHEEVFLSFQDTKLKATPADAGHNAENIFIRKFKDMEYYIEKNTEKTLLTIYRYKTDHIKPIKKETLLNNKYITLDIETMVISDEHVPYCVCVYDGEKTQSFYLSDYSSNLENSREMIKDVISFLLKPKYSGHVVYAYNLSHFDGILST